MKLKTPVKISFKNIKEIDFEYLFTIYNEIKISEEKGYNSTMTYIELISIRDEI